MVAVPGSREIPGAAIAGNFAPTSVAGRELTLVVFDCLGALGQCVRDDWEPGAALDRFKLGSASATGRSPPGNALDRSR